ncbi:MAG: flagellar biosynthetic protein FliO [Thiobacillaceae bacterium]
MLNKAIFVGGSFAYPALAHAAQTDSSSMAVVFLSLLVILGGFVLAAFVLRRYLPGADKQGIVKVVGATMVGSRERVVVVEIDNTWLLLGVAAGQVRLLDKLAKPGTPHRDKNKYQDESNYV